MNLFLKTIIHYESGIYLAGKNSYEILLNLFREYFFAVSENENPPPIETGL